MPRIDVVLDGNADQIGYGILDGFKQSFVSVFRVAGLVMPRADSLILRKGRAY